VSGPDARPAVAVVIHDGYYSYGTGAGRSNHAFLEAFTAIARPGIRFALLPVHLTAASSEYDPGWHDGTRALIQRAGGQVLPAGNGSGGQVRFGGLDNFRAACTSAAGIIRHRLGSAAPMLIIAFDVPFYGLARHLAPPARRSLVNVARSTAVLHAPGEHERIAWERDGLHATAAAGGRVAAISAHMRHHLATGYGIPQAALLNLPNGLTSADWHPGPPATHILPAAARRGFILALGRAVPCKGFDDLIGALALLKAQNVPLPHTLIAAVTETRQRTPYQQHLARRISDSHLDATLLTRFTRALRSLLGHPGLAAVVVPSRAEPFGRIPLEAFAAGAAPVVATTAGGLAELVTDGQTGYTARPADPRSLAAALRRALACAPADRARLRAAGRHLAVTHYNHHNAVAAFFATAAPWAVTISAAAPAGQAS
jgi:glycosyltransferase involved in cell wall biosynthesis